MFTGKTGWHVVQACILLCFCLVFVSKVFAEKVLVPESMADYGSGASAYNLYYAGGVPDLGLFVGQANSFHRNDRALVKFRISSYLLINRPVDSAELCFEVGFFTEKEEDVYEIEITHLSYEANSFSADDLLNSNGEIAGNIFVKVNEFKGKEYSIDVAKYVNNDITEGNVYSSFRFKNITAEKNSTGKTGIMLGSELLCKPLPSLKIRQKTKN